MQKLTHITTNHTVSSDQKRTHAQRIKPPRAHSLPLRYKAARHQIYPCLSVWIILALILSIVWHPAISHAASKTPLIVLSSYSRTMKIGQEYRLWAVTSDLSIPAYSSSKRSIASIDSSGLITAKKAGTAKISVKSGKSITYCNITVSKTKITLNKKSVSLEHGETCKLTAKTSNDTTPVYKSNKKSVATVSDQGKITALKPGEAVITIKADQTEAQCKVKVKKPKITLSASKYTLTAGQNQKIKAKVSSGLDPVWSSSKSSVAFVDQNGQVTAVKAGTATIKAKLDGITATCVIHVQK